MPLLYNCNHLFMKNGWSFGRLPWKGRVWKCEFCDLRTRKWKKSDKKAGLLVDPRMTFAKRGYNTIGKWRRLRTK